MGSETIEHSHPVASEPHMRAGARRRCCRRSRPRCRRRHNARPNSPSMPPGRRSCRRAGSPAGSAACAGAPQDHVYVVNRRDITDEEKETSISAPSIIRFDLAGNVVGSWGDQSTVPGSIHGCEVDRDDNVWVAGNGDGIVQKYAPDGKLLLQIGTRGKFDSVDGTRRGAGLNAARDQLHMPAGVAVDPANGDVYVADGYGNRRVAVFDRQRQVPAAVGPPGHPGGDRGRRARRVRAGRALHRDEQCRAHLRVRPPGQPRPGVPEGRHVRAQHLDQERHRQAPRQARHRLVGRVLARPRAEIHVRDERRHRAGAHPRPRQRRRSCRASAGPATRSATSPTATPSRSTRRAASTWRRPTGAGASRSSGS